MKFWFDTEFDEDGRTIELLSIGVVAEDGTTFYAENMSADLSKANDWVRSNVLPHMKWIGKATAGYLPRIERLGGGSVQMCSDPDRIASMFLEFVGLGRPEFWAYYADYDWVVLCQLFGRMVDLPEGWPMFCMDVQQLRVSLGSPQGGPPKRQVEHNALEDALWARDAWQFLMAVPRRAL